MINLRNNFTGFSGEVDRGIKYSKYTIYDDGLRTDCIFSILFVDEISRDRRRCPSYSESIHNTDHKDVDELDSEMSQMEMTATIQYKSQGSVSKIYTFSVWCEIDYEKAEICRTHDCICVIHDFHVVHSICIWYVCRIVIVISIVTNNLTFENVRSADSGHIDSKKLNFQNRDYLSSSARMGTDTNASSGDIRIEYSQDRSERQRVTSNSNDHLKIRITGWISQAISGDHWARRSTRWRVAFHLLKLIWSQNDIYITKIFSQLKIAFASSRMDLTPELLFDVSRSYWIWIFRRKLTIRKISALSWSAEVQSFHGFWDASGHLSLIESVGLMISADLHHSWIQKSKTTRTNHFSKSEWQKRHSLMSSWPFLLRLWRSLNQVL